MKQPNSSNELQASMPVRLLTAGTAACFADAVTFPLDTAKVRLQVQGETVISQVVTKTVTGTLHARLPVAAAAFHGLPLTATTTIPLPSLTTAAASASISRTKSEYRGLVGTMTTISRQEGPRALYNGLSAGLQRQMCFASVRLGLYDSVKAIYQDIFHENPQGMHIFTRVMAGLTTGGMAVVLAQPTDVVKVRFQAQRKELSSSARPRYTSTMQAYRMIGQQEGMAGLWKGAMPNIGRNAVVNVSEIVCYDVIKDCLLHYARMNDNIYCHFTAAVIAGFATTVAASPIDVVKTRYMNSPTGQYSGALDCAYRMQQQEGFQAFYKGFVPSFARIVGWNIVLWITYEQLKQVVFSKKNDDQF